MSDQETPVVATTEFQVTDVPAVLPPHSGETLTVVASVPAPVAPEPAPAPEEPAPAAPVVGPAEPVEAPVVPETVEELTPAPVAPVQSHSVFYNYNGAAIQKTPEYEGKRIAGQPVIEIQGREYSADSLTIEWQDK